MYTTRHGILFGDGNLASFGRKEKRTTSSPGILLRFLTCQRSSGRELGVPNVLQSMPPSAINPLSSAIFFFAERARFFPSLFTAAKNEFERGSLGDQLVVKSI